MEISNRTIFRILLSITAFIAFIYLAFLLSRPLIWMGTALFLAIAINPLVEKMQKVMPRKNRGLAVGVTFVLLLAALALVVYMVVPPLVKQTQELASNLPTYAQRLQESDSVLGNLSERYGLVERAKASQGQIAAQLTGASVGIVKSVFGGLIATLTILTLTILALIEAPSLLKQIWEVMPESKRRHRQKLAGQMYQVVAGWVTGRLLIALIAAVAATVALMLLGVPYAITLGIIVGLLDLVPLFGATLGAVVVTVTALVYSTNAAIVMVIFFVIYQQLENNVIVPIVDSRTVQLSPLLVLVSAIIGISLGGIIGALVAIPTAACLQILVKDYFRAHSKS